MLETAAERVKQARALEEQALERFARIDLGQLTLSELLKIIDTGMKLEMKACTY